MSLLVGVVVAICFPICVGVLALWWWVTRIPIDRRDHVSQVWRDEHSRERRD